MPLCLVWVLDQPALVNSCYPLLRVQLLEHQKLMRAHILAQGLGDGAHSIFYDRDLASRKCSRIRLAKLVRI